jgi:hypothetical protein
MAYAALVNVNAEQCGTTNPIKYVNPGSPATSYLIDKLLGTNLCNGVRMPRNANPLPTDEITTIQNWICQGAHNN